MNRPEHSTDLHQTRLVYCEVMAQASDEATAPEFLRAAGHSLRLLGELAGSDWQVRELTVQMGQPLNPVSYHLGQLRQAGRVTGRRSADGRDTTYRVDFCRCAALLTATGGVEAFSAGHHPNPFTCARRR
jgi:hypothetical protein